MKVKPKKCKVCKTEFRAFNSLHVFCSGECAIAHSKKVQEKRVKKVASEKRKAYREAKEKLKTRSEWMSSAQKAVNAYIRKRDEKLPCISCGRYHQGQYHAGHYRTVGGNPELRFEELNIHKQCSPCNNHLHGNIVNYRIGLRDKIGDEKLEWLEGKHEPKHYTIDDLREIEKTYKLKLKELEAK